MRRARDAWASIILVFGHFFRMGYQHVPPPGHHPIIIQDRRHHEGEHLPEQDLRESTHPGPDHEQAPPPVLAGLDDGSGWIPGYLAQIARRASTPRPVRLSPFGTQDDWVPPLLNGLTDP